MSNCKKLSTVFALIAALCLCLFVAVLPVRADSGAAELIKDGSFDKGDMSDWPAGWSNGTFNGIDPDADHTGTEGSTSLKLVNATRSNQHAAQKVTLSKGQAYVLKASIKTENVISSGGGTGAFLTIGLTDANSIAVIGYYGNGVEYGTNDWFDFSTSFTAAEDGEYTLRVRLWGSSGTMWCDDVSLIAVDKPDIGLDDGKFASDKTLGIFWNAGWKNTGAVHEWSDISHTDDGTGSLKIEHGVGLCTSSYAAENVYLVQNAKYKVSGWIKTENMNITSANNNVGAYFAFDEKYNFFFGAVEQNGTKDWTYYEAYFTATETATHKMECKIWGANGTAWFDDIEIEMVAEVDPEILKHWTDEVEFPVDDGGFTLVGVGDTQGIAGAAYAQRFLDCFDWLAGKKDEYNIEYVAHLGDIVDNNTDEAQWTTALAAHQKLQDAGLKYSLSPGNHDYNGLISLQPGVYVDRDTTDFNAHFKRTVYDEWLGDVNFGAYNDTMDNTWHKFEVGGVKYMIIALEYGPNDDVLAWAKGIADANPDSNVIVTTHAYINGDADLHDDATAHLQDANGGNGIWTKFVKKCPNIFMVLSGHYVSYGVSTSVVYGEAGNSIVQIKIDPQNILGGGEPMLALLRITNGTDVSVYYYSTYQNKYYAGSNFSLKMAKGEESGSVEKFEKYSGKIFEYAALDGVSSKITYRSSNTSVATVAADGTVTCLKPGTTTITCNIDSKQSAYATSGVLTKYSATLKVNALEMTELFAEFDAAGSTIYTSAALDSLKQYVTATAKYNDGNTYPVDEFALAFSGEATSLQAGENTLVVTCGDFSANITVTATAVAPASLEAEIDEESEFFTSSDLDDILAALTVTVTNNDGSTVAADEVELAYKTGDALAAGSNIIVVSANGLKTEITVTAIAVAQSGIEAVYENDNTVYTSASLDGLKKYITVTAVNNDGSMGGEMTDYTLSLKNGEALVAGENAIVVAAGTFTCEITVQAEAVALVSVSVEFTQGENVIYTDAALASLKNMLTVKAKYNDGSEKTVTDYTLEYADGKESFVKGENTVVVKYGDKSASFTVKVSKKSGCGAIGAAAGGGIATGLMVIALLAAVAAMLLKRKRA